jgi:PIN domain nuclease of toxin-antitoxin system
VRLLLDTHAVLWWFIDDPQLPAAARGAIADPENQLFVSACVGRNSLQATIGAIARRA